jgi:hypothetical protein
LHAAADFRRNADAFLTLYFHAKNGDTTFAHHLHFALDGLLDVLWIKAVTANDHVVRIQINAEAVANQQFIGHQVAVTDLHPFRQRGGYCKNTRWSSARFGATQRSARALSSD